MNQALLKALAEMESDDDRPGVKALTREDILEWALGSTDGGLPGPSARAFADWLDDEFYGFNEDGDKTNEQVLKGARAHWVGETR